MDVGLAMGWKLILGRLRGSWADYPRVRRLVRAVPARPPIFLTGSHRSGTTWLASMLAASGIWYIHEPFNPNKGRWSEMFSYRRAGTPSPDVDALAADVLAGGFREALGMPNSDRPWMPLRALGAPFSTLLVKDPLACLLTSYLADRFGVQPLVLFRHPAGFAASIIRLGWRQAKFLEAMLRDEALMADHLEPQRALLERYSREESLGATAALHGALYRVLWRWTQQGIGRALSFETLCADPIGEVERLFGELGLPYDERVREQHVRLCLGRVQPAASYRAHAVERNSRAMADGWRETLDSGQLSLLRGVWEQFEVPLYDSSREWELPGWVRESAQ